MAMTEEEKRIARNEASKRWYAAHKAKNAIKAKKETPKKALVKPAESVEKDLAKFEKKYGGFKSDTKEMLKAAKDIFSRAVKSGDERSVMKVVKGIAKCGVCIKGTELVIDDTLRKATGLKPETEPEPEPETKPTAEDEALAAELAKIEGEDEEDEEDEGEEFFKDEDEDDEDPFKDDDEEDYDDEDDILGGAGREERAWGRGREEMFDEYSAMGCDDD